MSWTTRRANDMPRSIRSQCIRVACDFVTGLPLATRVRFLWMASSDLVERLAGARIGSTYNQYTSSELRRDRLRGYLTARADAPVVLVGEAAGYRGARVSGLAFTSERQLTGAGPAEASARR